MDYSYNLPAAINTSLQQHLGSSYDQYQWQINLLYTVYSLPNFILPLLGGILIDALGHRTMLVLFSVVILGGQALFAVGNELKNFNMMVVGRAIVGAASDSVEISSTVVSTDWFRGRFLAFALAAHTSVAALAGLVGDNLSPRIGGVVKATWLSVGTCGVGLMCAILLAVIDTDRFRLRFGVAGDEDEGDETDVEEQDQMDAYVKPRISSISHSTQDSDDDTCTDEKVSVVGEAYSTESSNDALSQGPWSFVVAWVKNIFGLPLAFWFLCLATVFLYSAYSPFHNICVDFFQSKWWPNDPDHAAFVMSISALVSTPGGPITGLLTDRFGFRSLLLCLAGLLLLTTHLLFTFTFINPLITMMIMGGSASMFPAIIWSSVPLLVDRSQLATAYGMVYVCVNVALSVVPLAVADVRNRSEDWLGVGLLFVGVSAGACLSAVALVIVDARRGFVMHKSGQQLDEVEAEESDLTLQNDDEGSPDIMTADEEKAMMARENGRRFTLVNPLANLTEDEEQEENDGDLTDQFEEEQGVQPRQKSHGTVLDLHQECQSEAVFNPLALHHIT
ncbi:hypothetical protein HDV00_008184 [Rhizophlyctis rosea]|nr:hypothetical protein HDV00_008184 [Rhizophlyctis rosea]